MALAAYRHVLRAMNLAFQNDARVLTQARLQARQDFDAHRDLDASSHHARERVQHAEQVAQLLRHNVVQGVQVDGGESEAGSGRWQLNLHPDTEMGDNESVKMPGKTSSSSLRGQGCCQTA